MWMLRTGRNTRASLCMVPLMLIALEAFTVIRLFKLERYLLVQPTQALTLNAVADVHSSGWDWKRDSMVRQCMVSWRMQ
eukprot:4287758-Amphidinium_carterae.1